MNNLMRCIIPSKEACAVVPYFPASGDLRLRRYRVPKLRSSQQLQTFGAWQESSIRSHSSLSHLLNGSFLDISSEVPGTVAQLRID